ncbi:hypothetical protein D8Q11_27065, partial [Salmonella enterica]|nr:hypothetical protein [Salmonella enterica]
VLSRFLDRTSFNKQNVILFFRCYPDHYIALAALTGFKCRTHNTIQMIVKSSFIAFFVLIAWKMSTL